jgi:outer membrane protein assembly factor BamB
MPDATSSKTPATKRRSKIANAILARVFVYGGIGLVIVIYIVGFRGLLPRDRMRHRSVETTSMNTNHEGKPTKDAANSNSFPVTISPKATEETNWPNWRGLHYDGRSAETDLADTWPAEGPPVLWMREIGQGYSSVIAVENCVYTQSQTLTEQKVLALDAQTGETVWEHRYGWPYDPGGMYPGPRSTPTWADGKLYIAAPDGLILCLDATDGREIWSVNVNKKFGGRGTEFGYSASPLVENGKVILPVGAPFASVVALDAATGATVWKSGSAAASYCMALPITFAGRRQVVVFLQNELAGFDLQSGILLWGRSYSKGYDEHAAMPLYDEPYLRTMQPFRGGSDLFILHTLNDQAQPREGEASDDIDCRLKLVRTDKQMSNDVASSVLVDGCVYGFDLKEIQSRRQRPSRGEFRCMDFKTGEIHWSNKTIGQASIAVGDNKLFLFNDSGEAILLRVNAEKCEELARTEVFRGEICWTAPCLHHGRMYLRSPTKLACLYVGKPESLEIAARKQAQPTSAIPKENRLELNWIVGAERDAAFDLPDAKELTAWYWCCVVAIGISAFVAAIVYGILRFRGAGCQPAISAVAGQVGNLPHGVAIRVFYLALLLCGIAATPLSNRICSQFVFTWPVALFAAHQIALMSIFRAKQAEGRTKNWLGVLGAIFLVLACLFYYDLTKRLSLGAAWYFLPTFLAAWPLALPTARRIDRRTSIWGDMLWLFAAFSLYFWISAGFMLWRNVGGS